MLELVEVPDPVAGPGLEVLEVSAAGVNYADTHATGEEGVTEDRSRSSVYG